VNCMRVVTSLVTWIVYVCAFASPIHAQSSPVSKEQGDSEPSLMRQMEGTWDAQQRMWPGSGAGAINLPPAVARRRLIGGKFLEEVMEPASESKGESFTRIAYFNYNVVNQQYEYFSVDTRAPQMMNEKSYGASMKNRTRDQGEIALYGDSFVAPRWGEARNAPFRYRLTIGQIQENQQVVRLYLTPQSGESGGEFLAFEYVYIRRR
jgi:Protein of unknown function (DUF1579)